VGCVWWRQSKTRSGLLDEASLSLRGGPSLEDNALVHATRQPRRLSSGRKSNGLRYYLLNG
jgi:hypothetical protein